MGKMIFHFGVILLTVILVVSCRSDMPLLSAQEQQAYIKRGDSLSKLTFDTLRNTLMRKILSDGVSGAVRFCKVSAGEITATYSNAVVDITRTSMRYRNSSNKPDNLSVAILEKMQAEKDEGAEPASLVLKDEKGVVHFYKPVLMQAMCLNCHGTVPGQIQPDVLKVIDSLYPGDLARQYKEGELRGAWHIRFSEKQNR
jgi:Protein of unknown function (DUF3365)